MKTLSYGLLVFAMSLSTSVAAAPEPQVPRTPPTYQQLKAVAAQLNQMRQSNNRGGFRKVSSDPTGDYNTCMSLCAQESEEAMRGCYGITYDPSGDRYRDCELAAYTAMASCQAGCG